MRWNTRAFLSVAALLGSVTSWMGGVGYAAQNAAILIVIEEPEPAVVTGIRLVRGFALAPAGVDRVTWFLDDVSQGAMPYGGARGDVTDAFPGYPDSSNPGFATAFNYGLPVPGEHEVRVRVVDLAGDFNEDTVTFTTDRFSGDPFIRQDEISLDSFVINGVQADAMGVPIFPLIGEPTYELELQWSQAAQQFVTRRIDYLGKLLSLIVAAPGNLTAVKAGDDVDLTWDDISGELGFYIERRFRIILLPAGEYERIATVAANDTDYTDDDVDLSPRPLGGFFEYRVQGFTAAGPGFYSASDSVSVPIGPLFP